MASRPSSGKTLGYLLELNREHSELFIAQARKRAMYRQNHPTEIGVIKCSDGRVHIPVYTGTPLGVIQPWRNIGGIFDLGWPFFQETILSWADFALRMNRNCLMFVTYHFAKGMDGESAASVRKRCCAGHDYDTAAAREASLALKLQLESAFRNDGFYAIQCGVETDKQALIFHGHSGEQLDLTTYSFSDEGTLLSDLERMYPIIPVSVLKDLLPIVIGNLNHIAEGRNGSIAETYEHEEAILAFGRGFDWMHIPNKALIVGPYALRLDEPILKAGSLLLNNLEAGRVSPQDGLVLLVSAPFRQIGHYERFARNKALAMTDFAKGVLTKDLPELMQHLQIATAVCDLNTRQLHML